MLAFIFALALTLAPAPHVHAYLSLGTSELAYDGQDSTTATMSLYSTVPMTVTLALTAPDQLLIDRAPRTVFVAPDKPVTLSWHVALDQTNAWPSRTPLPLTLLVNDVPRVVVPVRAWVDGVLYPHGSIVWLPLVRS